jgi:hypothetical protein
VISRRSTLLLLALPLRGDERSDIVEWLGKFAGYLTDENSEGFLRTCEKSLRGRLETNIRALVRTYEIASSITVISVAGDGERREVELDWFLELQSRASSTATLRRRERLKLTIERAKKNWTVLDIGATTLFDPAQ